ncbi:nicotinate-nucleotide--dimethylbenzimidazole phosphoribosyltransferase [Thalassobacillus cyri]|uniref:Nicotinate-nucleotide--dimethylbenzimidazole phosphoribosyltransferase n=1 Tax=Thalassobacillus cyri TaxID=571932 RepID=A0A1H3VNM9_9BACI|nr:nicotinate-nucleotide--dimethylbenzimidazole phosphoribosyltransferase [Thalassobacillus cyri]SDZ76396.1 nicotinate-nucleotide--dimethylbenzimidazole phosphoribosyltransferase [Thalassobacillus cyri]
MNKQLQKLIESIEPVSQEKISKTTLYLDTLTKPPGSLGKLEDIAIQLAGITNQEAPQVSPPGILVFAADHGIVEEGVSAFPQEVTVQMIRNFLDGGAAINVFARQIGAELQVVDVGAADEVEDKRLVSKKIAAGTRNFLKTDAMTEEQMEAAVLAGTESAEAMIARGIKCLILGEMGIGNTTAASALVSVLAGCSVDQAVGYGTGISNEVKQHKRNVIEEAVKRRNPDNSAPLDVLKKLGGYEIAAITGAILAAAKVKIPVILDGFICTSGAIVASRLNEHVKDYLFAGHVSQEQGHQFALEDIGLEPLLELGLKLGEGTGAALAFPMLEAAVRMRNEMATFDKAGVTNK